MTEYLAGVVIGVVVTLFVLLVTAGYWAADLAAWVA